MPKSIKDTKNISRRKFFLGGLATGAMAISGILIGDKKLLADSIQQIGDPRWEITINGKVVAEGLLPMEITKEMTIPVTNGTARIILDHGRIYMPDDNAICEKKICSMMGSIMKSGEKITCLPNKLVIRIL